MILLTLSRGKGEETVRLQLPASPAEIGEAFASLDRISLDTAGSMAAPSQRTAGVMAILRKQKITVSVYAVLPFPASIRGTSIAMIFASRRCTDRNTLWWVG